MINTIAFREYVQWQGEFRVAVHVTNDELPWSKWLTHVNYVGKRGGFVQAIEAPSRVQHLDSGFTELTSASTNFSLFGVMQIMDDCSPGLTFGQVNIYSDEKVSRVLRHVSVPYRLESSSRGYSLYCRMD